MKKLKSRQIFATIHLLQEFPFCAVRIGACNIYHGCVHNMLHEKSEDLLRGLCKSASFVVQAVYFAQSGRYVRLQADLAELVCAEDRGIVDTFLRLKNGEAVTFREMSEQLFVWAQKCIQTSAAL